MPTKLWIHNKKKQLALVQCSVVDTHIPNNSFQWRWVRIISAIQINITKFCDNHIMCWWYRNNWRIYEKKNGMKISKIIKWNYTKRFTQRKRNRKKKNEFIHLKAYNVHITCISTELCNGFSCSCCITILSASQRNVTPFSKRDAVNVNWLYIVNVKSLASSCSKDQKLIQIKKKLYKWEYFPSIRLTPIQIRQFRNNFHLY